MKKYIYISIYTVTMIVGHLYCTVPWCVNGVKVYWCCVYGGKYQREVLNGTEEVYISHVEGKCEGRM